ncbi:phage tail tape measure protein, partial [bacterium]
MSTITALLKLTGDASGAMAALNKVEGGISGIQKVAAGLTSVGKSLTTYVTLPIVAMGGMALKAAIDFESAFTGVIKTTDGLVDPVGNLTEMGETMRKGFRDLALEIPIAATELAGIGEAAGQLGIEAQNILGFTEVMAKLGVTTNLSSEQASMALAKLANVTGMPQTAFENLGSSVVALGNNMATTEADIVSMASRIAGAGSTIGLTEAEILGFAAALSSVGIEAAAGGSSISKVMVDIATAVANGGEALDQFAAVAGVSSEQFATSFKTAPAEAIDLFIQGLGKMQEEGTNVFAVLDEMGLSEIRTRDALLKLAGAEGVLTEALEISNAGWTENTALMNEAATKFGTTESQMALFKNTVVDIGITLGGALLPAFNNLLGVLQDAATGLSSLPGPTLEIVIGIAALAAAIGPVVTVIGALIGVVGTASAVVAAMGGVFTLTLPSLAAYAVAMIQAAATTLGMSAAAVTLVIPIAAAVAAIVALKTAVDFARQVQDLHSQSSATMTQHITQAAAAATSASVVAAEYQAAQARVNTVLQETPFYLRIFINEQKVAQVSSEQMSASLLRAATSYADYTSAMTATGQAAAILTEAQYEQAKASQAAADVIRELGSINDLTAGQMGDYAAMAGEAKVETDSLAGGVQEAAVTMEELAAATEAAAQQQSLLQEKLSDLQTAIQGPVKQANETYLKQEEEITGSIAELQTELAEYEKLNGTLVGSVDDLTLAQAGGEKAAGALAKAQQNLSDNTDPEKQLQLEAAVVKAKAGVEGANDAISAAGPHLADYSAKIEETKGKIEEWQGKLAEAAAAHRKSIQGIIFDMVQARLAADGWTEAEYELSLQIAESMGLIDTATADALSDVNDSLSDWEEGMVSSGEVVEDLAKIVDDNVEDVIGGFDTMAVDVGRSHEDFRDSMEDMVGAAEDWQNDLVGNSIIPDTMTSMKSILSSGLGGSVRITAAKFAEMIATAGTKLAEMKMTAQAKLIEIKAAFQAKLTEAKATVQAKLTEVKTVFQTKLTEAKTATQTKLTEIKTAFQAKLTEVKAVIQTKLTEIKTIFLTKLAEVKTTVETKLTEVKTAVTTKVSEFK